MRQIVRLLDFHGTASLGQRSCLIIEYLGRPQRPYFSRPCSFLPDRHPTSLDVTIGNGLDVSWTGVGSRGSFSGLLRLIFVRSLFS